MKQQSTEAPRSSSVQWDNLESWVRGHVQGFIQQILEEEVSEFLGRSKPQRRRPLSEGGSQCLWEIPSVDPQLRDDHGALAARARLRGAVCEPGIAAVQAQESSR